MVSHTTKAGLLNTGKFGRVETVIIDTTERIFDASILARGDYPMTLEFEARGAPCYIAQGDKGVSLSATANGRILKDEWFVATVNNIEDAFFAIKSSDGTAGLLVGMRLDIATPPETVVERFTGNPPAGWTAVNEQGTATFDQKAALTIPALSTAQGWGTGILPGSNGPRVEHALTDSTSFTAFACFNLNFAGTANHAAGMVLYVPGSADYVERYALQLNWTGTQLQAQSLAKNSNDVTSPALGNMRYGWLALVERPGYIAGYYLINTTLATPLLHQMTELFSTTDAQYHVPRTGRVLGLFAKSDTQPTQVICSSSYFALREVL